MGPREAHAIHVFTPEQSHPGRQTAGWQLPPVSQEADAALAQIEFARNAGSGEFVVGVGWRCCIRHNAVTIRRALQRELGT